MSKKELTVQHRTEADTEVFALSGDLMGSTQAYAFQEDIRRRISEGTRRIVIDLSAVQLINSSGIGILVGVMWSASEAKCGLVLAALPPKVEKVLGITQLLGQVQHAPTVAAAMKVLDAKG